MTLYLNHSTVLNLSGYYLDGDQIFSGPGSGMSLKMYAKDIYQKLEMKYSKFYKMDEFCKVGILAAESLPPLQNPIISGSQVGIFLVNSFSSIQTDQAFHNSYYRLEPRIPSPSLFVYTLPNILIGELAIKHKITGEHCFFIQENFDLEFIYLYIKALFESGTLNAAIVGSCEVNATHCNVNMGWISDQTEMKGKDTLNMNKFKDWISKQS